jgi:DNA-binding MarR family transcriptional regulator
VVTQFYDAVLRPSGLRVTQFTLLQALHHAPEISQKQLAELLAIDSTTLTRTLAPCAGKDGCTPRLEPIDVNCAFP